MSTTNLSELPAFQSNEADRANDRPPLSKMAVVSMVVGLLSLFAAFTIALLPLSIFAVALGAVVLWRVSHDGTRGAWLAQIGFGLGIASAAWSITATSAQTTYLNSNAGSFAKIYLDYWSQGRTFDALELRLPIRERQIAGTDLEAYYRQRSGEPADHSYEIINSSASRLAVAAGSSANWQFVRGVQIQSTGSQKRVTVEMKNLEQSNQFIQVLLRRETYQDSNGKHAGWMVEDAYPVDSNGNRT